MLSQYLYVYIKHMLYVKSFIIVSILKNIIHFKGALSFLHQFSAASTAVDPS
jgi:hypothetical protein